MSKTYTAKEFNVAFYEAMLDWVKGGYMGESPWDKWECTTWEWLYLQHKPANERWITVDRMTPLFCDDYLYRWKPEPKRTVIIDV